MYRIDFSPQLFQEIENKLRDKDVSNLLKSVIELARISVINCEKLNEALRLLDRAKDEINETKSFLLKHEIERFLLEEKFI